MRKSQKSALVAATVVGMVGGGVAFAYWTSTGTGNGSATTGTDTKYTVTVDNNGLDKLYPGGPATTINFKITNTGAGVQKVQSATAAIKNADGSAWNQGTCNASDFTVSPTTDVSGELAKDAFKTGSFTITLDNNSSKNQDDCKSATVPLQVTVS